MLAQLQILKKILPLTIIETWIPGYTIENKNQIKQTKKQ